ncbi:unnamed protein product [Closterium sp. Naga37s-1]|nr:unnamed protein product [Closterium sp. Naga37s-1]
MHVHVRGRESEASECATHLKTLLRSGSSRPSPSRCATSHQGASAAPFDLLIPRFPLYPCLLRLKPLLSPVSLPPPVLPPPGARPATKVPVPLPSISLYLASPFTLVYFASNLSSPLSLCLLPSFPLQASASERPKELTEGGRCMERCIRWGAQAVLALAADLNAWDGTPELTEEGRCVERCIPLGAQAVRACMKWNTSVPCPPNPYTPHAPQASACERPKELTEEGWCLERCIRGGAQAVLALAADLNAWDAKIGDGDCGSTVRSWVGETCMRPYQHIFRQRVVLALVADLNAWDTKIGDGDCGSTVRSWVGESCMRPYQHIFRQRGVLALVADLNAWDTKIGDGDCGSTVRSWVGESCMRPYQHIFRQRGVLALVADLNAWDAKIGDGDCGSTVRSWVGESCMRPYQHLFRQRGVLALVADLNAWDTKIGDGDCGSTVRSWVGESCMRPYQHIFRQTGVLALVADLNAWDAKIGDGDCGSTVRSWVGESCMRPYQHIFRQRGVLALVADLNAWDTKIGDGDCGSTVSGDEGAPIPSPHLRCSSRGGKMPLLPLTIPSPARARGDAEMSRGAKAVLEALASRSALSPFAPSPPLLAACNFLSPCPLIELPPPNSLSPYPPIPYPAISYPPPLSNPLYNPTHFLYPLNDAPATVREMGASVRCSMGGTSGVIYDIFCRSAYVKLRELAGAAAQPTPAHWAAAFEAAVAAVSLYGGAQAGYRTMLDALLPAAASLSFSQHHARPGNLTRVSIPSLLVAPNPSPLLFPFSSAPTPYPPSPASPPLPILPISPGAAAFEAAVAAVSLYGGAQAGYRTMLDALLPAAATLSRSVKAGESAAAALAAAAQAAAAGAESTKSMPALAGRSSYVPAEVLASVPDPGAMAVAAWLQGAATAMQPPEPVVESVAEPAAAAPSAPQEQL